MKILIVEDDPVTRKMLTKIMEKVGHEVITAVDGQKAWEIISQKTEISMIISDWMMPKMDGVSLCKAVRKSINDHYIYFIILTAKDKKEDLIEVYEAGADDYIKKPLDIEEVKARIKTGERIVRLEKGHKDLQDTLIESRNKLMTVFDTLREEIVSIDREWEITSVNKSLSSEIGMDYQEIIGKNLTFLLEQTDTGSEKDSIIAMVKEAFKSGEPPCGLISYKNKKGDIRQKEIHTIPVKDHKSETFQVVITCRDITEEKKKTDEINALNKKLREAFGQIKNKNKELEKTLVKLKETQAQILHSEKMSSIGQLAAGVAHEINNPTGFVSSNLRTLADYQDDISGLIIKYRELIEYLKNVPETDSISGQLSDIIKSVSNEEERVDIDFILNDVSDLIKESREGTNRVKKIVLDLKDFAHPGEDKLQVADINKSIESTLNIVWNEIKYKATVSKDFGDIPHIQCYAHQLNQVFMNLLVNAAQAIEKDGEIRIATKSVNGNINITISDNGSGIAKENIEKIFDPFFTTKEVGKGTGLGLNVVYNIIKKHNGTIDVDSVIGKGTCFSISLPVGNNS